MRSSYSVLTVVIPCTILWITGSISSAKLGPKTDLAMISDDNVYNYLMEFGYLPKSNIETGNLRTVDQLKDAIRDLQKFGNIPETGEIDNSIRKLILRPRCGVPDKRDSQDFSDNLGSSRRYKDSGGRPKRFALQGAKWDHTDLTWSLVNQTMTTMNTGELRSVLANALAVWQKNSKLTFKEVNSNQADIQVLFARKAHGDGYNFDGPGMVLAHAFYPAEGRGGDAHFDEEESWLLNASPDAEGTNLMGVAVHEFGHSLGLGHSSVENAIMYPWYHGYQTNGGLPEDDRLAIQNLYGFINKQWGPYNPSPHTTTTTTTTTTTRRPIKYYPDPRPTYTDYPRKNPDHRHHYPHHNPNEPRYSPNNTPYSPNDPRYPGQSPPRTRPVNEIPSRNPSPRTPSPRTPSPRTPSPRTENHRPRTGPHYSGSTHIPRHKHHPSVKTIKPDSCKTSYDAISMLRGELFIFKDQYLWRIKDKKVNRGYPTEIRRIWMKIPEDFSKIDAVYENKLGHIVFFIGRLVYAFSSVELVHGYPRALTELGIPSHIDRIDAALIWGHNNRTYLYSGTLYWRFDEDFGRVELDYPRDMSIWDGIGYHIDSGLQYTDGKTYFFKGLHYWEFDDSRMRVAHYRPKLSAHKWMNCPKIESNEIDRNPFFNSPLVSERNFPVSKASSSWRVSWRFAVLGLIGLLLM